MGTWTPVFGWFKTVKWHMVGLDWVEIVVYIVCSIKAQTEELRGSLLSTVCVLLIASCY